MSGAAHGCFVLVRRACLLALAWLSALDRGFGRRGIVLSDFGTGADWIGALEEQQDGKIVAAGEVYGDQAIARYLPR